MTPADRILDRETADLCDVDVSEPLTQERLDAIEAALVPCACGRRVDVPALVAEVRRLRATDIARCDLLAARYEEIRRLKAIIAGRAEPPTDAEIDAQAKAGGSFLVKIGARRDDLMPAGRPGRVRAWRNGPSALRWWAYGADGCLGAWPVVAAGGAR